MGGETLESCGKPDERIKFHMNEGAVEFTADDKDTVLARVQIDENDIVGELLTVKKHEQQSALECVRKNADGMSEERVDQLAKHLAHIKRKTPVE